MTEQLAQTNTRTYWILIQTYLLFRFNSNGFIYFLSQSTTNSSSKQEKKKKKRREEYKEGMKGQQRKKAEHHRAPPMGSHYQGQGIAEGTFVKFWNPVFNIDNSKFRFKKYK